MTVNKWFQSTPTLKAKCQKERAQRQKQKATKAAKKNKKLNTQNTILKEPLNNTASDIEIDELKSSDDNMETRPMKKAKTSPEINPYINLVTPACTAKLKTMDARGPFFFTLDTTHDKFLQSLAACSAYQNYAATITSINRAKLFWKQNVPANNAPKPLANAQGFWAMIRKLAELTSKNKDKTLTLILPPLAKVAKRVSILIFIFSDLQSHLFFSPTIWVLVVEM